MNIPRLSALALGLALLIIGGLMALPGERQAGQALIIGGAIIIAGFLVASAVASNKR